MTGSTNPGGTGGQKGPQHTWLFGQVRGLRWWICALLFFATTINYIDRTSISVLKTTLQEQLGWNEASYGWIAFAFSTAYAMFFPIAGRIIDVLGVRLSFALALVLWSIAAAGHGLVASALGFAVMRFALGAAESANFPASIKAVAQWFPQRERAFSTGIFNAGSNVGIMLSPLTVWLALQFGWQLAFFVIGGIGLVWLVFWLLIFRTPEEHPGLTDAEREYIVAGRPMSEEGADLSWRALLRHRQVWPFLLAKFMTDPVWWFFLYWLPSYLEKERGLTALTSAGMLIIPYVAADIGSIFGGWFSGHLISRGWRVGPARYTAMLLMAACMPGAIVAVWTQHFWLALTLISLATAAHQGWSANVFTTATDMFPARVAGSVVGLGGTSGAIGGMLMALLVGGTLQWFHSYVAVFIWAGLMHPSSLIFFRLLAGPDLRPITLDKPVDLTQNNRPLLIGGAISIVVGVLATVLLALNWSYFVTATNSTNAPAGGITAAVGVALIGCLLFYAGLGRRNGRSPAAAVR